MTQMVIWQSIVKNFIVSFMEFTGLEDSDREEQTMKELDLDNDGRISFPELLKWLNWVSVDYFNFV